MIDLHPLCACCEGMHKLSYRAEDGRSELSFVQFEIELSKALSSSFDLKSEQVLKLFEEFLADPENNSIEKLARKLEDANAIYKTTYESVESGAESSLTKAILTGAGVAALAYNIITETHSYKIVKEGINKSLKYYTNKYFNDFVAPKIISDMEKVISGQDPLEPINFSYLRESLNNRLKSVPYWNVVANAAMSRGYHYGLTKAGQLSGKTGYVYNAVLDNKTSEICKYLNGRVFWLADAVNLMEKVASADADKVKEITPWLKDDQVVGKSNEELRQLGAIVPPQHGNCRSTIILI